MSATESENSVFSRTPVNAMPAPTWHRLMVNSQVLVLPKHYEIDSEFELEVEGAKLADKDAFDSALAAWLMPRKGRPRPAALTFQRFPRIRRMRCLKKSLETFVKLSKQAWALKRILF